MKVEKNQVVITKDGWVYVITKDKQFGLGDIDVDVDITDLRGKRKKTYDLSFVKALKDSGMSVMAMSREIGLSRPTIYKILKNI